MSDTGFSPDSFAAHKIALRVPSPSKCIHTLSWVHHTYRRMDFGQDSYTQDMDHPLYVSSLYHSEGQSFDILGLPVGPFNINCIFLKVSYTGLEGMNDFSRILKIKPLWNLYTKNGKVTLISQMRNFFSNQIRKN